MRRCVDRPIRRALMSVSDPEGDEDAADRTRPNAVAQSSQEVRRKETSASERTDTSCADRCILSRQGPEGVAHSQPWWRDSFRSRRKYVDARQGGRICPQLNVLDPGAGEAPDHVDDMIHQLTLDRRPVEDTHPLRPIAVRIGRMTWQVQDSARVRRKLAGSRPASRQITSMASRSGESIALPY